MQLLFQLKNMVFQLLWIGRMRSKPNQTTGVTGGSHLIETATLATGTDGLFIKRTNPAIKSDPHTCCNWISSI